MSVTTGTFPGVRIVDMPDLGAVTDNSSVVGEHAGSGRFSVLALRDYIGHNIVNVLDHGAMGDGVSNDTSAIQTLLNGMAGKAIVFIPDTGHPFMTMSLTLPSGTDLLIHGTLMLLPGSSTSLLQVTSASNVTVRGHGIIDGNGANTSLGAGGLSIDSASNVQVEGVTIRNAKNWNLNITQSSNVKVDRVTLIGGENSNEFARNCDDCWITNSTISGPTNDGAWTFYGGVTNSGMSNCIIRDAFVTGIGIYSDTAQPAVNNNIVIADNVIYHNKTGGISIESTDPSITHTGITITGNRFYANNNVGNHQYADIWVAHGSGVTIAGNDMSGGGSGSNPMWGVFIGTYASHVNITGNTIWNQGQGGTSGAGVFIQSAPDVLIEANHFYDSQTTHTMAYGIQGNAGARNVIIGNSFSTLGTAPMLLALASDTVTANAVGNMLEVEAIQIDSGLIQVTPGIYISRDGTSGTWSFVDTGNVNLTVRSDGVVMCRTQLVAGGLVQAGSVFQVGANQVVGARINGWGTSTGGVRAPVTASSTLPQVAAALSQLLSDLRTHGLLGV